MVHLARTGPRDQAVPAGDRNLLWLVFADPYLRELTPDWEYTSLRLLAQFRAEARPRLGRPSIYRLIERLLKLSELFRAGGNATTSKDSPRGTDCSTTPSSATFTWSNTA